MTIKVKPLEWREKLGFLSAQTDFVACYSVWNVDVGRWECSLLDGSFPTAEAAQAAAQRDYETRIMSAITVEPFVNGNGKGTNSETPEKTCLNDPKSDPENENIGAGAEVIERLVKALRSIRAGLILDGCDEKDALIKIADRALAAAKEREHG
ncbi:hypothetical protein [Sinorhizobium sp. M4_45]|uniref:hypothetical protein n=1 Tax=Sinorhizobium sp. M4_45 TaxID=2037901 RepID=UPI000C9C8269|nr:hypothetical protein [Sinorhizobium sp. M4_45]PND29023.1 hypothetical protein CN933_02860 [Sinorhizobium sp. M4_45]